MIAIDNNPHEEIELSLVSPGVIESALSESEIKKIEEIVNKISLVDATVDGEYNPDIRSCRGGWVEYEDDTAWLYGRLYDLVSIANDKLWKFDPIDMVEPIMYCEYSEGDHYDWHVDMGSAPPFSGRKLAISVQLSISDEYRGGNLYFMAGGIHTVPRSQGSIIIYPTYIPHTVEKISAGTRKSLVFWVGGTPFK